MDRLTDKDYANVTEEIQQIILTTLQTAEVGMRLLEGVEEVLRSFA